MSKLAWSMHDEQQSKVVELQRENEWLKLEVKILRLRIMYEKAEREGRDFNLRLRLFNYRARLKVLQIQIYKGF